MATIHDDVRDAKKEILEVAQAAAQHVRFEGWRVKTVSQPDFRLFRWQPSSKAISADEIPDLGVGVDSHAFRLQKMGWSIPVQVSHQELREALDVCSYFDSGSLTAHFHPYIRRGNPSWRLPMWSRERLREFANKHIFDYKDAPYHSKTRRCHRCGGTGMARYVERFYGGSQKGFHTKYYRCRNCGGSARIVTIRHPRKLVDSLPLRELRRLVWLSMEGEIVVSVIAAAAVVADLHTIAILPTSSKQERNFALWAAWEQLKQGLEQRAGLTPLEELADECPRQLPPEAHEVGYCRHYRQRGDGSVLCSTDWTLDSGGWIDVVGPTRSQQRYDDECFRKISASG